MAKPINPYQGPAPAAMAQMGQGLMEAGANAARITQAGYESMGKSIAGGVNAITESYKQYKDDQAKFDATKKMFKAFGGSLNEEERKGIQEIFDDTSISTREKNFASPAIMQYMGAAQQQRQALEKQQRELDAAAARTAASEAGATGRTAAQIAAGKEETAMKLLYGSGSGGNTSFGGAPGRSSNQFAPQNFTLPDYGAYGQQIPIR